MSNNPMTSLGSYHPPEFGEVLRHIRQARQKAFTQANSVLIELYWQVGKTISEKVQSEAWGKGVVSELARYGLSALVAFELKIGQLAIRSLRHADN